MPFEVVVIGLRTHIVQLALVRRREDDGLKRKFVQHSAFDKLVGSSHVPGVEGQVLLEGVCGDVWLEGVVRVRRKILDDLGRGEQVGGDEDGGREEGQTHGFGWRVVWRGGGLIAVVCGTRGWW